ncbi:hypothetical protein [Nocardioides jiangxiensis]|uniref:Uncharacterized protein n=1 Tax=Nocardioides jiangxiensis TaxID=3064524 RepID=A0ABT9B054_9ACTN|nr:hypothetical protein [Nocardioides sp. WY-20]MDO7868102.1 hypothetical protein [Nocardioides sp. WY-20]
MDEKRIEPDDWTDEPTGGGGALGTASSGDQRMAEEGETDDAAVVSGGGVVDRDEVDPADQSESATSLD